MTKPLVFLALTSLLLPFASARDDSKPNLLQNGDFSDGNDQRAIGWIFPLSPLKAHGVDAENILRGTEPDKTGNRFLTITTTAPIKAHVWWQQEVVAQPAATYELTVRLAGEIVDDVGGKASYLSPDVLIYFLNKRGSWMGYEPLTDSGGFTANWKTVTLRVTTPEDVAKIGVRLGMKTSAQVKVRFDDAKLIQID